MAIIRLAIATFERVHYLFGGARSSLILAIALAEYEVPYFAFSPGGEDLGKEDLEVGTSIMVIKEVETDVLEHAGTREAGEPEQVLESAKVAEMDGLGQAPKPAGSLVGVSP
ncbi:hypothetical protein Nepgr_007098 [Nepenthes gracilis]|uniref:Uncharacterized protein n=1 Tax=Nepenthes gracilis TaxID=150966 RepID=A0AAD3S6B4_NEPGR|nr:hypothetical protein Nepgr_007098 [Nepenthes gracilis]